jgi:hypothetical protein
MTNASIIGAIKPGSAKQVSPRVARATLRYPKDYSGRFPRHRSGANKLSRLSPTPRVYFGSAARSSSHGVLQFCLAGSTLICASPPHPTQSDPGQGTMPALGDDPTLGEWRVGKPAEGKK